MALSVFPERMDKLNTEDTAGSLLTIENYLTYMKERVEFSLTNMMKSVQGAGISNAEVLVLLAALSNSISAVAATLNQVQGTVTGLQATTAGHMAQLAEDQASIAALNTSVQEAKTAAGVNTQAITQVQSDLANLTDRVTALEQEKGGE